MRETNTKKTALYGLLTALALILSYIESQIPVFFAVPGMKLGLTNLVVLLALYLLGSGGAFAINFARILLAGLLFGNGASIIYSLCGGMLSTLVMVLLFRTEKFQVITVSIAGGVSHNIGQILAAAVLLKTASLAWYLLVLWFSGMAAGTVIGFLGGMLCRRLKPAVKTTENEKGSL